MKIRSILTAAVLLPASVLGENAVLGAFKGLDYRYFVAGGTCAAISHGITTPLDVVKTRIVSRSESIFAAAL